MEAAEKKQKFSVKDMVFIAIFAALMAVCAWITIPIPIIPFTLQLFAVFAALFTIGGKFGTISIVIYVLLGLIGVPVFSGFKGGIGVLAGNTGGYIVGFIFTGLLYWLMTSLLPKKLWAQIVSAVAGLIICYAFGTAWFIIAYSASTGAVGVIAVLTWCVFPYIIPDLAKIALAMLVSKAPRRALHLNY